MWRQRPGLNTIIFAATLHEDSCVENLCGCHGTLFRAVPCPLPVQRSIIATKKYATSWIHVLNKSAPSNTADVTTLPAAERKFILCLSFQRFEFFGVACDRYAGAGMVRSCKEQEKEQQEEVVVVGLVRRRPLIDDD